MKKNFVEFDYEFHTEGGDIPPNLSCPPYISDQMYFNMQQHLRATSLLEPQKLPEVTLERKKVKNFLGKHTPDHGKISETDVYLWIREATMKFLIANIFPTYMYM